MMNGPLQVLVFPVEGSARHRRSAINRACDRCRQRKSRCNGLQACRACTESGAPCTYKHQPGRPGRKPNRQPARGSGKVADPLPIHVEAVKKEEVEAAEAEEKGLLTCAGGYTDEEYSEGSLTPCSSASSHSKIHPSQNPADEGRQELMLLADNSMASPRKTTTPLAACASYIRLFFRALYPIFPVLDEASLQPHSELGSQDDVRAALIYSLSAAVMVQLNITDETRLQELMSHEHDVIPHGFYSAEHWMKQCLILKDSETRPAEASEHNILTSFFCFEYFGNRGMARQAWHYLLEAINLALLLRLDQPQTYIRNDETAHRRKRIFWLLFITECAYALQHGRGTILRPTIELPRIAMLADDGTISGFTRLIMLFGHAYEVNNSVNEPVFLSDQTLTDQSASMIKSCEEVTGGEVQQQWLDVACRETQNVDFQITRHWLRILSWKKMSREDKGCDSRQRKRQIHIIQRSETLAAVQGILQAAFNASALSVESHGIGVEQKMFDVATYLIQVVEPSDLMCSDISSITTAYLHGFLTFLTSFRNQRSAYYQPLLDQAVPIFERSMSIPRRLCSKLESPVEETRAIALRANYSQIQ